MAIIKGTHGAVVIASGTETTLTDEATTANGAKTVFNITDRTKKWLCPSTPVVVKYDGSAVTDYATLQKPGGIVTWAVTPGNSAVTISGKYYATETVATQAKSWSMDLQYDMVDATVFGDTFRVQVPLYSATTVTFEQFYADDTFHELMRAGNLIGWSCYAYYDAGTPANNIMYMGYGYLASDGLAAPVDNLETESLTINVSDGPYYVAGLA